jgi:hypothetical protein
MTTQRERIDALLVDEATEGLDVVARLELEQLLAKHPEVDRYGFQRAAAIAFLAACRAQTEEMPSSLRSKLVNNVEQFVAQKSD